MQIEYKVEIIDFQNVITKDQQLSYDQSDNMFYELIDWLIENCIGDLADFTLDYIKDKSTVRFQMTQAKIRVIQKRYSEAVSCLDGILKNDEKNQ